MHTSTSVPNTIILCAPSTAFLLSPSMPMRFSTWSSTLQHDHSMSSLLAQSKSSTHLAMGHRNSRFTNWAMHSPSLCQLWTLAIAPNGAANILVTHTSSLCPNASQANSCCSGVTGHCLKARRTSLLERRTPNWAAKKARIMTIRKSTPSVLVRSAGTVPGFTPLSVLCTTPLTLSFPCSSVCTTGITLVSDTSSMSLGSIGLGLQAAP